MMSSCSVDKCSFKLLTVCEALALYVVKVKLEIQTLQSGKVFSTNAFKIKADLPLPLMFL